MSRRTVWLSLLVFILLSTAGTAFAATWNLLTDEWKTEQAAAQFALNHSPLEHIIWHDVFTGDGVQNVFYGTDVFGRPWYVFVSSPNMQVSAVPATGILTHDAIVAIAKKDGISPRAVHLGYLSPATRQTFQTNARVVWEIYGQYKGRLTYTYFDAASGRWIWQYML